MSRSRDIELLRPTQSFALLAFHPVPSLMSGSISGCTRSKSPTIASSMQNKQALQVRLEELAELLIANHISDRRRNRRVQGYLCSL